MSRRNDRFNAEREIEKYSLDVSTFDVIDVDGFKNHKGSTIFWYIYMWVLVFLSLALLATDVYTCLNILVFHKWGTEDYKPYAYSVAKWIFTGCIIFQVVLLIYHFLWSLHIYRTKNIALVYLNSIAKRFYSIRSFSYFCLFNGIDEGGFFDFCCFLCYYELDNAFQILIADAPRQVINILTLRYYATGGELNNAILQNIVTIAKTNLYLAVILGFMCLSVLIFAIFFIKFVFGMLCYIPVKCSLRSTNYPTLKSYCSSIINRSVAKAVGQHHKPKQELLDQGILSKERISQLPPLPEEEYTRLKNTEFKYRQESVESIPMKNFYSNNQRQQPQLPKRSETSMSGFSQGTGYTNNTSYPPTRGQSLPGQHEPDHGSEYALNNTQPQEVYSPLSGGEQNPLYLRNNNMPDHFNNNRTFQSNPPLPPRDNYTNNNNNNNTYYAPPQDDFVKDPFGSVHSFQPTQDSIPVAPLVPISRKAPPPPSVEDPFTPPLQQRGFDTVPTLESNFSPTNSTPPSEAVMNLNDTDTDDDDESVLFPIQPQTSSPYNTLPRSSMDEKEDDDEDEDNDGFEFTSYHNLMTTESPKVGNITEAGGENDSLADLYMYSELESDDEKDDGVSVNTVNEDDNKSVGSGNESDEKKKKEEEDEEEEGDSEESKDVTPYPLRHFGEDNNKDDDESNNAPYPVRGLSVYR
ncbi:KCH1 [[Candida] subhashii]|uniref:KCH1 n=1 Tax=[Candida] subhashii TaxID=561895 RepID=A0A8J5QAN7_9ASCO|nr:KCH1 [[Candida] subhashii]KAG7663314.1 KCH1 [[Candida] subhashii]